MRDQLTMVFKAFFREKVIDARKKFGLSQEKMASKLEMACRSYVDLEHGKTCCGALTLILFLQNYCDAPDCFLSELREKFEKYVEKSA